MDAMTTGVEMPVWWSQKHTRLVVARSPEHAAKIAGGNPSDYTRWWAGSDRGGVMAEAVPARTVLGGVEAVNVSSWEIRSVLGRGSTYDITFRCGHRDKWYSADIDKLATLKAAVISCRHCALLSQGYDIQPAAPTPACGSCKHGAGRMSGLMDDPRDIACRRYPEFVMRHRADVCGEFEAKK